MPGVVYLSLSYWPERSQTRTDAIALTLGCPAEPDNLERPIIQDTVHLDYRALRNQGGTTLEASSLLASFRSARRCSTGSWERQLTKV